MLRWIHLSWTNKFFLFLKNVSRWHISSLVFNWIYSLIMTHNSYRTIVLIAQLHFTQSLLSQRHFRFLNKNLSFNIICFLIYCLICHFKFLLFIRLLCFLSITRTERFYAPLEIVSNFVSEVMLLMCNANAIEAQ